MTKQLPHEDKLKINSRELRKHATKHENHLWYDFLRTYKIQFNRQKIIGQYIVDFYCPKARIVIELDGSQHYENEAQVYDEKRTAYFHDLGLYVLRFTNLDIDQRFEGVCRLIDATVNERLS
jgi:very-short-patch-repair endonuclease